ncbi:MAG: hypothetical protein B6D41_16510 [Chloroflexi bacterium UTCFX4]|jgi:WD40 repeat protein|nr:MAG: hypothetical protein B6D41_16510 [Chloroflexi bacterium UTCFX4]
MSERQPRKSNPSPSPYNLAALLIVIALVALVVGLFSFGAFNNRSVQPTAVTQAQAIESPTSKTVETPTDAPTSDVVVTVVVTETATLEFLPTPSETASEPTVDSTQEPSETLAAETPTSTDDSPTELPTLEPTLAPEETATQELPTTIPTDDEEAIVYVSDGELYAQPVNRRGSAIDQAMRADLSGLPGALNEAQTSPTGQNVFLDFTQKGADCTDACEAMVGYAILSLTDNRIQVLEPPTGYFYGWHPDGTHLLFRGIGGTVCLFNIHTQECKTIANVNDWLGADLQPSIDGLAFSPDGEEFIVSFDVPGKELYQTWISASDGANARKVMEGNGPFFEFAWSPDGKQIAFIHRGLEVIDRNGENRRTLSRRFSVGWGFSPRWSPDSQAIAFEAVEELPHYPGFQEGVQKAFQSHKMHTVDLATLEERRVIPDEQGGDIQGAWSPDGKRMMVLSNRSGTTELWVVNLQNGNLEQISTDEHFKRTKVEWLAKPLGKSQ